MSASPPSDKEIPMPESRTQKILRELNEELKRDKAIILGMSSEQRHALTVIIMIVAVLALVAGLVWASVASAATFPITVTCPKDQANNTCTLTREDADKVFALIQHNNAVTQVLQSRKCNALNDS